MRNVIIGLSIVCFVLSGIIILKALGLPQQQARQDNTPPQPEPTHSESDEILGQLAREQETNRAILEKLQTTIANLENKLSKQEQTAQANIKSEPAKKETRVLAVFGSGTFGPGQIVINDVDEYLKTIISEMVRKVSNSANGHVLVEGHTDNTPIRSSSVSRYRDNMDLSFLRAKAVANLLVKNGIALERISVIGYGATRPIASNETVEGRAKNRRVIVKLVPPEKEF